MWIRESHILFVGRQGLAQAIFKRAGAAVEVEAPIAQFTQLRTI